MPVGGAGAPAWAHQRTHVSQTCQPGTAPELPSRPRDAHMKLSRAGEIAEKYRAGGQGGLAWRRCTGSSFYALSTDSPAAFTRPARNFCFSFMCLMASSHPLRARHHPDGAGESCEQCARAATASAGTTPPLPPTAPWTKQAETMCCSLHSHPTQVAGLYWKASTCPGWLLTAHSIVSAHCT